jgi:hypothetical protein
MKKFVILVLLFTIIIISSFANSYTLSGYIKDAKTGEGLIGASAYIKELKKGIAANNFGFYSITLPEGKYTISFTYIGYTQQDFEVQVSKEIRLNVDMISADKLINEVTVSSKRSDKNVESSDMGRIELSMDDVKKLPALFGEVDIMRTIQLLPGVMSAGEGNSGFYVRGGGPDQNLVLLDNAVVYNPGHLFGFFSIFNSDIIKNTTLIKGGMPANYGGRSSSVLDISMKEGNMKKWQADGGIGLLASRLTIQGPIKKEKCSIILSGRRTYVDLISKPILKKVRNGALAGNTYYFYDLNGKINYKFSDKDRLFISGYYGKDAFKFSPEGGSFNADLRWGNATATIRWNHLFSDKLFMNTSLIYNQYNFDATAGFSDIEFKLKSGVRDLNAMLDFDYFPSILHAVKFGFNYTNHTFTPSTTSGRAGETTFNAQLNKKKYAHEYAAYLLDDIAVNDWIKINVGARVSGFTLTGPYKKLYKNNGGVDTVIYQRKDIIQNYAGFEPRISARFRINKNISIKAGVTVNKQYMHLVSRSTTTLPFDVWVPSTDRTKPQTVIQYALGYFQNFKEDMFEASIEGYYKDLRNQVEYGESYVSQIDQDEENGFTYGSGQAYGVEFFFKKAKGKFTGWVGYTLAYTWRKFPELNGGNRFPAKFDRRHDISVVLQYDITKKLNISTVFVYGTGNTTTMPIGRYFVDGNIVNEYGARNGYRLPAYHRWDISLTYIIKDKKWYSDINFSIYNVYSRQNPFFIFNDIDGNTSNGNLTIKSKQVSLFPILPSITWNFKI